MTPDGNMDLTRRIKDSKNNYMGKFIKTFSSYLNI